MTESERLVKTIHGYIHSIVTSGANGIWNEANFLKSYVLLIVINAFKEVYA